MSLFNRKTIQRHINEVAIAPEHLGVVTEWADLVNSGRIRELKEVALHGQFTAKIVEGVLGYSGPASGAEYTVATEQTILRGSVDLALGRFGGEKPEIIAPFELKGADTRDLDAIMPGRNKSPVQQAWEYATNAPGVKWVLVSNYIELRLYGFGEGTAAYEAFRLDQLTNQAEYARFRLLLSAESLLSGRTLDLLKESRREDKDITDSLYRDYKSLRLRLLQAVQDADIGIEPLDEIALAQKILDRVLFVAFAEDTGLLPMNTLGDAFKARDAYNPKPIWENFKGLFRAIDQGSDDLKIPRYNGGLFRADDRIDRLGLPDAVCEGFKTLGEYDFASEISVTVLGHIFEQSIADVERLQAAARGEDEEPEPVSGTSGRRKRDGVVYTPDYIARFIVAETLGRHLREIFAEVVSGYAKKGADLSDYEAIPWRRGSSELDAWEAYRERLHRLRIVDPACGSGVFLVVAFDFMKAELTRVNDKIKQLSPQTRHYGDLLDYVTDSEILSNNLFGVDVNEESVEITKLSLWIKTARRGKVLDSLAGNIRVGDSLIEDSNFAYLDHAFTWETAFPEVFAEGGFDVVLGNPPYVRMEFLKALKPYLEKRYEVVSDRADLYCYFYERGLRLLKPGGRLGYISSNTFFKTGSGRPLRRYLLREATIEGVVDFGDLQVFEGVTTYPAILVLCRGQAKKDHHLNFWKVETLPEANFLATWETVRASYPQSALGDGSWELESPALRELREKIRRGGRILKEVYGAPLRGVVTGLNEAFVIDTETKDRLCAADPKSADLLKPFLEGKDLKRWRSEPRGLWLIYIPKNRVRIDDYPAIRDWLLPFKDRLEKRATKQEWFELQQAQEAYAQHFGSEKISYPHFNSDRNFSFDTTGAFSNDKSYMVPSSDTSLLALLNSRVFWFLLSSMSPPVRGGYHELRVQYVETMPVPKLSESKRSDLSKASVAAIEAARYRLDLQRALVRRLPDLCPSDREPKLTTKLREWWRLPDFASFRTEVKKAFKADIPLSERSAWEDWIQRDRAEISRLSAEIRQAEAEIDRIVYGLFDLSEEEIQLLERACAKETQE
ncbi:MAG: BREX-1 system adenine-specific DNA-methyltransferase PglX [Alphaproteobacteria bacterium]|nr:BREX-1 system adenine-specific DNA-methyltransferase PglX [Alphaproteobacteria bacterium]